MTAAESETTPIAPTRRSFQRRRSGSGVLLGAKLDHGSRTSLQGQLHAIFQELILGGRLRPGARLPSTRGVTEELGISRNTVMLVFEQLRAEGYVSSRVGSGTRVSDQLPHVLLRSIRHRPAVVDTRTTLEISARGRDVEAAFGGDPSWQPFFSPGMPAIEEFPFAAWSRLLSAEWSNPGLGALSADPAGYRPLREAVAEYVAAARGISCDEDQVIIVSGNREGTELATRVLLDEGDRAVVEEPGYPGTRAALRASGVQAVPLRVDADGLMLSEAGPACRAARMLLTAPSHQYPLGGSTSLARRLQLITWGHTHRCWIVEDDYDSEFRFSGRPLPSLYSLDPDGIVIYTGTFSKTAFPSLRLGYLIVPRKLVRASLKMKQATTGPVTLVTQRAMARFMETGAFDRHVRRMRGHYGQRRSALHGALLEHVPDLLLPAQENAGLFLTTLLRPGLQAPGMDVALTAQLRREGIHLEPLSPLYLGPTSRQGLIFGYGSLRQEGVARALKTVARRLAALAMTDR